MKENFELRNQNISANNNTVEGYAIVFDKESQILGDFIEIIKPEAVTEELLSRSTVCAYYNHLNNGILAKYVGGRENNTLTLEIREEGLWFSFELPNTELATQVAESIKRGDVDGCSFAFIPETNGQKWEIRDGMKYRTITKIKSLRDISLVDVPAYPDTSVALRDYDEAQKKADEEFVEHLNKYYSDLRTQIYN